MYNQEKIYLGLQNQQRGEVINGRPVLGETTVV